MFAQRLNFYVQRSNVRLCNTLELLITLSQAWKLKGIVGSADSSLSNSVISRDAGDRSNTSTDYRVHKLRSPHRVQRACSLCRRSGMLPQCYLNQCDNTGSGGHWAQQG